MIRIALATLALLLPAAAAAPRVLILGDSVYRQPQGMIAKELAGKIELVRPEIKSGELFSSTVALAHLDELLGAGKWDLVIFNVGIGDLIHRAPGMENFRIMPVAQGGVPNTSAKDYEANLNQLAERLKATGAKLVWVSTTPIRDTLVFGPGSEIGFNAIAAKVMAAHGIPVLDMHGHITRLTADTPSRAPQWETFGSNKFLIHAPLVAAICRSLSIPVPRKADK
jgi:acyl-CoA thioesterase-1